mmetsp:Transcript_17956/g.56945  ORF Transcript_17956/g.56945 Transcript_17956/m.56945 type:complete len:202 (-) Transcript_17956:1341-1946(-)
MIWKYSVATSKARAVCDPVFANSPTVKPISLFLATDQQHSAAKPQASMHVPMRTGSQAMHGPYQSFRTVKPLSPSRLKADGRASDAPDGAAPASRPALKTRRWQKKVTGCGSGSFRFTRRASNTIIGRNCVNMATKLKSDMTAAPMQKSAKAGTGIKAPQPKATVLQIDVRVAPAPPLARTSPMMSAQLFSAMKSTPRSVK